MGSTADLTVDLDVEGHDDWHTRICLSVDTPPRYVVRGACKGLCRHMSHCQQQLASTSTFNIRKPFHMVSDVAAQPWRHKCQMHHEVLQQSNITLAVLLFIWQCFQISSCTRSPLLQQAKKVQGVKMRFVGTPEALQNPSKACARVPQNFMVRVSGGYGHARFAQWLKAQHALQMQREGE